MKRRTFLIGTGSAAIGGSALLGSGAFSRVESQRAVTVEVAEDPDAYLGMDKCSVDGAETPNSSYAHLDDDGHLEILMNPDNPTIGETPLGEGINSDSLLWADNVFQLCNQGKEDVCVYIEDDDDWPRAPEEYDEERRVDFYLGDNRDTTLVGEENQILLELGECVCIGLKTNSKGLSEGDELLDELDNEIRIVADVDGECAPEPVECATLESQFNCITTDAGEPTGHRFNIQNVTSGDTTYGLAILNSPDEFGNIDDRFIEGNESQTVPGRDASFPLAGLVFWEDDDECEDVEGLTRAEDWDGIETPIGIPDPDAFDWSSAPTSRERYDEVVGIDNIEEFNAALDPAEPGEDVPTDVYVAEIDYGSLDPEEDWQDEREEYFCPDEE